MDYLEMQHCLAPNILDTSSQSLQQQVAVSDRALCTSRSKSQRVGQFLKAVAGACWCTGIASCIFWLFAHAYQPAHTRKAAEDWPSLSNLPRHSSGIQLVMFAHPCCPCTSASISEFGDLLGELPAGTTATINFTVGDMSAHDLAQAENVEFARKLGTVALYFDEGSEAEIFGATVSGEVLAYDQVGRRVFHGGVTSARGHTGESTGKEVLRQIANGKCLGPCEAPVFGCRLP